MLAFILGQNLNHKDANILGAEGVVYNYGTKIKAYSTRFYLLSVLNYRSLPTHGGFVNMFFPLSFSVQVPLSAA